jgi:RNA polymerase primary sigma factor
MAVRALSVPAPEALRSRPTCGAGTEEARAQAPARSACAWRRPVVERRVILAAKRGQCRERDQVVEAFMPLIARVAGAYRGSRNIGRDEFMQSGVVGLLQALERYDPSLETPFWGYASFWVRQSMQELLSEMTRPVVLSDRASRQLAHLNQARRDYACTHGHEASTSALVEETGIGPSQIARLFAAARAARGLDEPLRANDGSTATFGDRLADPAAQDAFDDASRRVVAEDVPRLLEGLSDRERELLRARYGLGGNEQTLREVGGLLSLSVERVRQLEERALEKLRVRAGA